MIAASASTRSSSLFLRSWSQKNFASESRARSTRSLPATMAAPPSSASRLATRMNDEARAAPSSDRARRNISGACASPSSEPRAAIRPRRSGRRARRRSAPGAPPAIPRAPATSAKSPASSTSVCRRTSPASACARARYAPLPLRGIENDARLGELRLVVREILDLEGAGRMKAVAARLGRRRARRRSRTARPPVEQADDRMQRPHPAQIARAPAHGLGPGESAHDPRHGVGEHRACGPRPCRSITANQNRPSRSLRDLASSPSARPVLRRKPSSALSGAPTFGPFALLRRGPAGEPAGRPPPAPGGAASKRSYAHLAAVPAAGRAPRRAGARDPCAARPCMRAGISSENSSSRKSAMWPRLQAGTPRLRAFEPCRTARAFARSRTRPM